LRPCSPGVVTAIDVLTKEVNEGFARRAVDHEIRIAFTSADGDFTEERFFWEVAARFPGAVAAIRRLIDRYCEVAERNDYLFSRGEEGIGIFASAVRTLAVLDPSALPALQRYGVGGLDKLARDVPQPHEPWATAFFDELERIFAETGRSDH
jgi:hypothetical protein